MTTNSDAAYAAYAYQSVLEIIVALSTVEDPAAPLVLAHVGKLASDTLAAHTLFTIDGESADITTDRYSATAKAYDEVTMARAAAAATYSHAVSAAEPNPEVGRRDGVSYEATIDNRTIARAEDIRDLHAMIDLIGFWEVVTRNGRLDTATKILG